MFRLTTALMFLLGAQAFTVAPNNSRSAASRASVKTKMTGTEVVDMITQMDPTIAGAIGASSLGLVGVAAVSKNNKKNGVTKKTPSSKVETIDVSIPYDAAARLAYDEFRANGKEADYVTFKAKWEQLAVAQSSVKHAEREFSALN